ncbi:hypothetical protein K3495_g4202 [Podosphaera aphanis]|nr:hypothetical protein K3495_g4202 [Podosphaera aphanis]
MKGLKRKAGELIEPSVTGEDSDTQINPNSHPLHQVSTMLWSWCKTFFTNGVLTTPSETGQSSASTSTTQDLPHKPHVVRREPSCKRQKIENVEPTLSRAKSMSNLRTNRAPKVIDISGCDTEQARQRIDSFWEPKPMPWMNQKSSIPQSDDEKSIKSENCLLRRCNSHPIESVDSQSSLMRQSYFRKEAYLGLQSNRRSAYQESLEESLKNLFLGTHQSFALSHFKTAQNLAREKERREKERKAAIEQARKRRLYRSYPQQSLVQSLPTQWENTVLRAHRSSWNEVLTTSIDGTELRLKDFKTLLDHRAWLNDEIINAYLEWIVYSANNIAKEEDASFGLKPTTTPKFLCHNSFFYDNLRKKGPAAQDRLMKRKGVPGLSLLRVDSVFVPICSGAHWTLGVVRPVSKTIEYFDSMGGSPSLFIYHMQCWLKHQLGEAYDPSEWSTPRTACARQTNGYDCGVFVCTNAFCVAVGLETSCYQEADMARQRRNIAAVLLNRGFHGEFAWKLRENGLFY